MITIVNADGPLLPMTRDLIDGVVEGLRPQVVSAETTEQGCTFLVNMSPDALTVEENMFKAFGISRVK
ncbi:hypothetical protein KTR10_00785 [Candidatus Kaiserbacteria bacterium]|nr:hypothetical protein [Candidatus Kaiserbacteria bacterium]